MSDNEYRYWRLGMTKVYLSIGDIDRNTLAFYICDLETAFKLMKKALAYNYGCILTLDDGSAQKMGVEEFDHTKELIEHVN